MSYKSSRIIPAFATEAEEADWWYEHREEITQDMIEAVRAGKNGEGTQGRFARMREAAKLAAEPNEPVHK